MSTIIDLNVYTQLVQSMGADFIGELIDTYLEETPQLIDSLHESLAIGDVEAFRRAAHSIKSSSASFGVLKLSAQARELEILGKSGSLGGAAARLQDLDSAYAQVAQALKELKNEP